MLKSQIESLEHYLEKQQQKSGSNIITENDNERLASKIQILNSEVDALQMLKQKLEKDLLTSVKDLATLKQNLTIKSTALDDAEVKLEALSTSHTRQQNLISANREELSNLTQEIAKLNAENHELASTIQEIRMQSSGTNQATKGLFNDISKLRTNLDIAHASVTKKTQTITALNE